MNTELFIAKRILSSKDNLRISQPIVRIAIAGIALGLTVMILAVAIITGFQSEIRNKVIGFGGHISITNYDSNSSYQTSPVSINQPFYPDLKNEKGIKHIQVFANKPGIIKAEKDIQGVLLKGIAQDYDWSFFDENIVKGSSFRVKPGEKHNKVIISQSLANKLFLDTGQHLIMYFIQDPPRVRKFEIEGIYQTSLEEYDKLMVLCDIAHIQKLNNWKSDQVSGFEVLIQDFDQLEQMTDKVYDAAGYHFTKDESRLRIRNIRESNPQIFEWLTLTETNVWIILTLMTLVAGFNMISGLLIIILERTNMIGILKALGARNRMIGKVFLYQAAFLIGKGMLWGNIIGISLCLIQYFFQIIPLDPSSYYVNTVPINLKVFHLILLNAGTLMATMAMLLVPSSLVARIKPIKAIQFN